jgi:Family of unknown function (DUF6496)
MPEKNTIERAKRDRREGKSATTQAGELVQEEMEHVKKGKHRVKSRKQAVAIGLSKARRADVNLPPPKAASASRKTRKSAASANEKGRKQGVLNKGRTTTKAKPARKTSARAKGRSGPRSTKRR